MTSPTSPAFPSQAYGIDGLPCQEHSPGLTIREQFAAMAMQGLMANPNIRKDLLIAPTSVRLADELLAELNKGAK